MSNFQRGLSRKTAKCLYEIGCFKAFSIKFKPFRPSITMAILQTIFYIYSTVLTRRHTNSLGKDISSRSCRLLGSVLFSDDKYRG